jgi:hypothetical protein
MFYKALLLVSTIFSFSLSYAQKNPAPTPILQKLYVGTTLGYAEPTAFKNTSQLKTEHGSVNYGISAGVHLKDWLRTSLEITHRNKKTISSSNSSINSTISLSDTTAFLNGYLMVPNSCPYLILGLGNSFNKFGDYKTNNGTLNQGKTTSHFAYQIGVGMTTGYQAFSFDGEIKYVNKGEAKTKSNSFNNAIKADTQDILFSIGIRYNF